MAAIKGYNWLYLSNLLIEIFLFFPLNCAQRERISVVEDRQKSDYKFQDGGQNGDRETL